MNRRTFLAASAAAGLTGLAGCATSKFRTYDGPAVTQLLAAKSQRRLYLLHYNKALAVYDFQLGFTPQGHKQFEGDGRTPEGAYYINRRNPESRYHLSIGISYPNSADRAFAESMGRSPGGDIFIHGTPKEFDGKADWTAGCIAVSDREIEDIYAMVNDGTPILLTS
ncbi:L,D-transpeptidase family protein [Pseudoroseicyclus sp. CLL3-39]|uniref:L,D-transpeptidase family protein n=1 Tax=Pseudoroseicyclus tamaricis TaxID=2705421 RepID=A0A6B2K6Y6_9RHOB|nr:L,D-transpeptidase family protein [Pseudoroseicyclus tamaricis]